MLLGCHPAVLMSLLLTHLPSGTEAKQRPRPLPCVTSSSTKAQLAVDLQEGKTFTVGCRSW